MFFLEACVCKCVISDDERDSRLIGQEPHDPWFLYSLANALLLRDTALWIALADDTLGLVLF